jgi:hypothetical protein
MLAVLRHCESFRQAQALWGGRFYPHARRTGHANASALHSLQREAYRPSEVFLGRRHRIWKH